MIGVAWAWLGCASAVASTHDRCAEILGSDTPLLERTNGFVRELQGILTEQGIQSEVKTGEGGALELRILPQQTAASGLGRMAASLRRNLKTEIYVAPYALYRAGAQALFDHKVFPRRLYPSLASMARTAVGYEPNSSDLHEIHHGYVTAVIDTVKEGVFATYLAPHVDHRFREMGGYAEGFSVDEVSAFAQSVVTEAAVLRRVEELLRRRNRLPAEARQILRQGLREVGELTDFSDPKSVAPRFSNRLGRTARQWASKIDRLRDAKFFLDEDEEKLVFAAPGKEVLVAMLGRHRTARGSQILKFTLINGTYKLQFTIRGSERITQFDIALSDGGGEMPQELLASLIDEVRPRLETIEAQSRRISRLYGRITAGVAEAGALVDRLDAAPRSNALKRELQETLHRINEDVFEMSRLSRAVVLGPATRTR